MRKPEFIDNLQGSSTSKEDLLRREERKFKHQEKRDQRDRKTPHGRWRLLKDGHSIELLKAPRHVLGDRRQIVFGPKDGRQSSGRPHSGEYRSDVDTYDLYGAREFALLAKRNKTGWSMEVRNLTPDSRASSLKPAGSEEAADLHVLKSWWSDNPEEREVRVLKPGETTSIADGDIILAGRRQDWPGLRVFAKEKTVPSVSIANRESNIARQFGLD